MKTVEELKNSLKELESSYKGNKVKNGFVLVNGKINLELSKERTTLITSLRKEIALQGSEHNYWEL
jgi:hypothetical protein